MLFIQTTGNRRQFGGTCHGHWYCGRHRQCWSGAWTNSRALDPQSNRLLGFCLLSLYCFGTLPKRAIKFATLAQRGDRESVANSNNLSHTAFLQSLATIACLMPLCIRDSREFLRRRQDARRYSPLQGVESDHEGSDNEGNRIVNDDNMLSDTTPLA